MRTLMMSFLVIACFACLEVGTAYVAAKEPFSRSVALRACQAEARKEGFGIRFLKRDRFIRDCIERRRAAR